MYSYCECKSKTTDGLLWSWYKSNCCNYFYWKVHEDSFRMIFSKKDNRIFHIHYLGKIGEAIDNFSDNIFICNVGKQSTQAEAKKILDSMLNNLCFE